MNIQLGVISVDMVDFRRPGHIYTLYAYIVHCVISTYTVSIHCITNLLNDHNNYIYFKEIFIIHNTLL